MTVPDYKHIQTWEAWCREKQFNTPYPKQPEATSIMLTEEEFLHMVLSPLVVSGR